MTFVSELATFMAFPLAAAGLAVVAWRKVLVPMARLLELSEDLAGVQSIPGPVEQRVIPARRTDTRWHGLGHIPGRLLHPHRGFTAG